MKISNKNLFILSMTFATILTGCSQQTTTPITQTNNSTQPATASSAKSFASYVTDINTGTAKITKEPDWAKFVIIFDITKIASKCPATPDGPCGFKTFIVGPRNWDKTDGSQTFYIESQGGAGKNFFGPYQDDLKSIVKEAEAAGGFIPTPDNQ
ncbi:MAG: hypothetical protein NTZ25_02510 [Candidatus Peregrinibacteria bacterium]|nr:hypothetical protein [Candidatus Peregrinibacteria bacterium]